MLTPTEVVVQGLLQPNPNNLEVKPAGERGRGLFTNSPIKAKAFICEYKYHKSRPPFPRKLRQAIEEEYRQSGEGCYILEAQDQDGAWWCFDATRRVNSYGRYINHAAGNMANAMPVPPAVIEGRLRVGFVATKNIDPGSEITWDYGVRGDACLCKAGKTSLLELCLKVYGILTFLR